MIVRWVVRASAGRALPTRARSLVCIPCGLSADTEIFELSNNVNTHIT